MFSVPSQNPYLFIFALQAVVISLHHIPLLIRLLYFMRGMIKRQRQVYRDTEAVLKKFGFYALNLCTFINSCEFIVK